MLKTWNGGKPTPEFNNAAQVVNHTFFWESMSPNGGGKPKGSVAAAIDAELGGYDKFVEAFKAAGARVWARFGGGGGGCRGGGRTIRGKEGGRPPHAHRALPLATLQAPPSLAAAGPG